MRPSSFRVQIVFWSVIVSGAVLLSFGLVAWWSLNHDRLDKLDESLTAFGFRQATRISRNADVERLELSLIEQLGEERAQTRFLALLRTDQELFRSSNAPEGVNFADYPGGEEVMDPQPYVPKPPPKPGSLKAELPPGKIREVKHPRYYTVQHKGKHYRLGIFPNREVTFVVGADLVELKGEIDDLKRAFMLALPGALLLVGLGAWLLSRRALHPIHSLERDMTRISARDLDNRLEVKNVNTEFGAIIGQYNAMLERLERSFKQATRFSADVSHELKTPLAIMRGNLERALADTEDPDKQSVFSDLLEQTDRQKAILENLLLLSRADSGHLTVSKESLDLSKLLHTWLEDASFLAEGRNITIESKIDSAIHLKGDPNLLQQVAHNLFSNAVRHNQDAGVISCSLSSTPAIITWTVANTGPLLTNGDLSSIFDRFKRGESTQGNGSGLGLSLIKEIINAHDGTISAEVFEERNVFTVKLSNISPL